MMAETERIEISESRINMHEVNINEIRPVSDLLMTHSVNSTTSGFITNTRMFNFGTRTAQHSRVLANLSSTFQEIRPFIEQTRIVCYI